MSNLKYLVAIIYGIMGGLFSLVIGERNLIVVLQSAGIFIAVGALGALVFTIYECFKDSKKLKEIVNYLHIDG